MRTATRIAKLERHHRIDAASTWRCPTCGHGRGRLSSSVRMHVTFGDEDHDTPEHCPTCGRRLVLKLEFDDRG